MDESAGQVEGATGEGRLRRTVRRLLGSEKVRFLIVGGFNTFLGYGLFVLLELLTGQYLGYFFSLYGSYLLATVVAFVLHRRFTFQVSGTGSVFVDFVRFQGVYVVSLAVNTICLPLLVEGLDWYPIVAQLVIVVITTLIGYFGHKLVSFRRPPTPVPPADSDRS